MGFVFGKGTSWNSGGYGVLACCHLGAMLAHQLHIEVGNQSRRNPTVPSQATLETFILPLDSHEENYASPVSPPPPLLAQGTAPTLDTQTSL